MKKTKAYAILLAGLLLISLTGCKNTEQTAEKESDTLTQTIQTADVGYYAHLITDAEFQRYIRDPKRVASSWKRIKRHSVLSVRAEGMPENWNSIKKLINKNERLKDIYTIEAEYLDEYPNSGYLTEIIGLKSFPDYIDYLPTGAIVRKINIMGYLPKKELGTYPFVAMSRGEYSTFIENATEQVVQGITNRMV